MSVMDDAWRLHNEARAKYPAPDHRLAAPFGVPQEMPEHHWIVSPDVLQALYDASPIPGSPNPKNGDDGNRRLFGWIVTVDRKAPRGTLRLERQ